MTITINPVLVSLGPLAVRWFGLLGLVGVGVAVWLSLRDLRAQGIRSRLAPDALAWGLPAGLLAARLVHVLGWWDYYLTHAGELWQWGVDGLSLWGGLLGGAAVGAARLRHARPLTRRRILDVAATNAAVGIAIGRLGEFLDGHGQGVVAGVPWATQYASPLAATPDFGVPRHPAQLYDALVALAVFAALRWAGGRLPAGSRFAAFGVVYGFARLALGAVRLDPAFLFGLQLEQLLAGVALAFGVMFAARIALEERRARRTTAAAARASAEDSLAA